MTVLWDGNVVRTERVWMLAQRLDRTSKDTVRLLKDLGFPVLSPSSQVNVNEVLKALVNRVTVR